MGVENGAREAGSSALGQRAGAMAEQGAQWVDSSLRRQKEKWGSDPRNMHWSTDTSRFGYKLLERMGWKEGAGLGSNMQGSTKSLKISKRRDTRGVGMDLKTHSDKAWLSSASGFQDVLARLNEQYTAGPAPEREESSEESSNEDAGGQVPSSDDMDMEETGKKSRKSREGKRKKKKEKERRKKATRSAASTDDDIEEERGDKKKKRSRKRKRSMLEDDDDSEL